MPRKFSVTTKHAHAHTHRRIDDIKSEKVIGLRFMCAFYDIWNRVFAVFLNKTRTVVDCDHLLLSCLLLNERREMWKTRWKRYLRETVATTHEGCHPCLDIATPTPPPPCQSLESPLQGKVIDKRNRYKTYTSAIQPIWASYIVATPWCTLLTAEMHDFIITLYVFCKPFISKQHDKN